MSNKKYRWFQVFGLIIIAVMLFGFVGPQAVAAQKTPDNSVSVGSQAATRHDTLPSLAAIPVKTYGPADLPAGLQGDLPIKEQAGTLAVPHNRAGLNGASSVDTAIPAPEKRLFDDPMVGLDNFWEGANQGSNRTLFGYGVYPPDTNGDASQKFYVQTTNMAITIWDINQLNDNTSPKIAYGPAPVNTLFSGFGGACEFTNDGDPIVLYDQQANRWLVSQFALPAIDYAENPFANGFYQCIAVSTSDNPTGGWNRYEYGFNVMNDYPHFGVWNDGYYMTIHQFAPPDLNWAGQGVVVFDRAAMLAGTAANMFYFDSYALGDCTNPSSTSPLCFLSGMLPGHLQGANPAPAGSSNVVMQYDDDAWGYSPDQLQLWTVTPNWTAGTAVMAMQPTLPVDAFNSEVCAGYARSCIPQPGTTQGLDAIADRLMYRSQYRNFGDHESIVLNHTVKFALATPPSGDVSGLSTGTAGVRWYELRRDATHSSKWYVYQQGDVADSTINRWMGSVAMDAMGNIALGYSVSSSTVYPGIRYTGRLVSDPLGTMPFTETALANGGGSQLGTGARWGDYSAMTVSPNGCEFYYTNEYNRVTSSAEWYTRIGAFHFDNCVLPKDTVGLFSPGNGAVYLKLNNTSGPADISLAYGLPGDQPIAGDWNGDGLDTMGVYRNGFFYLRNSNTPGFAERVFAFGQPGDQAIAGDWDGDGVATIGVYRSSNWTFYLRNSNTTGAPDAVFQLGLVGDTAITGDWNGDGMDSVGVYRPSNGALYLKNDLTTGFADVAVNYGLPGDLPVTGDWNNDGIDTIGVYRNGTFYLRNTNTVGYADLTFTLGSVGDKPVAGNWDALP